MKVEEVLQRGTSAHHVSLLYGGTALMKASYALSVGLPLKLCAKKIVFVCALLKYQSQFNSVLPVENQYAHVVHMMFLQSAELLGIYNQCMAGIPQKGLN